MDSSSCELLWSYLAIPSGESLLIMTFRIPIAPVVRSRLFEDAAETIRIVECIR